MGAARAHDRLLARARDACGRSPSPTRRPSTPPSSTRSPPSSRSRSPSTRRRRPRRAPRCAGTSTSSRSRSTTRGRATPARSSSPAAAAAPACDFGFNAWGEMFAPYDDDAAFAARVLEHLGEERVDAGDLILEGGSIAVDGEGTLITTEQCLLHPNRNPALSREQIEARLREALGVERIVWLGLGLVEDDDTDGHVDNICAWIEPGRVLLQTVADEADPNYAHCRENAERLAAGRPRGRRDRRAAAARRRRPADGRPVRELLRRQRRADRARHRRRDRRGRARAARAPLPGPRGGPGVRHHARPRGRRGALHHPAGPAAPD